MSGGSIYVPVFGDLDGDKSITAGDALIVLRGSVDPEVLSEREFLLADVDGDELITANDALMVLRRSAELDDSSSRVGAPIYYL